MNKSYLISLILLSLNIRLVAQWQEIQMPVSKDLEHVYFVDANTGFIVGRDYTILKTTDSGLTWEQKEFKPPISSVNFYSVFFINAETGWVAGDYTIAKTTEAGETWNIQTDTKTLSGKYKYLHFFNLEEGVAMTPGSVYYTNDGGNNWILTNELRRYEIYDASFINSTGWFVTSIGVLYKTTDKGFHWEPVAELRTKYEPNKNKKGVVVSERRMSDTRSLSFIDEQNGWAVGERNLIYRTKDGGNNWSKAELKDYSDSYHLVYFTDEENGWITGNGILRTTDGGENWIKEDLVTKGEHSIYFVTKDLGFFVGSNGECIRFSQ